LNGGFECVVPIHRGPRILIAGPTSRTRRVGAERSPRCSGKTNHGIFERVKAKGIVCWLAGVSAVMSTGLPRMTAAVNPRKPQNVDARSAANAGRR
jgi:hypothetical protein